MGGVCFSCISGSWWSGRQQREVAAADEQRCFADDVSALDLPNTDTMIANYASFSVSLVCCFLYRREFNSNKEGVEKKLVDLVLDVHIVAPEVRK